MKTMEREPVKPAAGLKDLRRSNELAILDELFRVSRATRVELAQATGLTKPTVSAALTTLVGAKLVHEHDGEAKYGASVFSVVGREMPVLGIDVGKRYIRAELAGFDDELLSRGEVAVTGSNRAHVIEQIRLLRAQLCDEAGIPPELVRWVAVAVPGAVDQGLGMIKHAGGFLDLDGTQFGEELGHQLGMQVLLENDVNATAVAELAYGATLPGQDFVMLHIGSGVGSALMLDGRLRRGLSGNAGEIDLLFAQSGPKPVLQDPSAGPMQEFMAALHRQPVRAGLSAATGVATAPKELSEVFAAYERGDEFATLVVDEVAVRTGILLAVLTALVDVDVVILTGGIGSALPVDHPLLLQRFYELIPWRPRIMHSSLGRHGTVMGARRLAVQRLRDEMVQALPA